ncbi:MAG: hypothetical protein HKL84_02180 [Acidimicrobiaceae bacterium]|nr:hypothetical protein [Acidimicrobiaceae bacterium]
MPKRGMVVGLIVGATLMAACGHNSTADQVASSSILVTKVNGKLNLTSAKQASLVDSSGIIQHFNTVLFFSKTVILASQLDNNQSVIFKSFDEGKSWHQIAAIPGTVRQLNFPNSQTGFAVSQTGVAASSSALYETSNSGQTWTKVFNGEVEALDFLNTQTGFAVMKTASPANSQSNAYIFHTQDGGKTWGKIASPLNPSVISASFSFVSLKQGWLLAGSATGAGTQVKYLYETVDGGSTWSKVTQSPSPGSGPEPQPIGMLPASGFVNELQFINASQGFIQLNQGSFLETQDGGKTWNEFQLSGLPIQSEKSILQFAAWGPSSFSVATSRMSFWITTAPNQWARVYPPYRDAGIFSGESGLYALSDKGELSSVETSSFQQLLSRVPNGTIQIDPFNTGIMAFATSKIYFSADGSHWRQVPVPEGWSLMQGHFISSDFGVVVANDHKVPGSAVLELTNDSGSTWEKINTKFYPYAIDPVTTTSWWALGGTEVSNTSNTAQLGAKEMLWNLYYTGDGGKSWDEFISNWHFVGGLDFVSTSEGYVWIPGKLYRTVDRGSSLRALIFLLKWVLKGCSLCRLHLGGLDGLWEAAAIRFTTLSMPGRTGDQIPDQGGFMDCLHFLSVLLRYQFRANREAK